MGSHSVNAFSAFSAKIRKKASINEEEIQKIQRKGTIFEKMMMSVVEKKKIFENIEERKQKSKGYSVDLGKYCRKAGVAFNEMKEKEKAARTKSIEKNVMGTYSRNNAALKIVTERIRVKSLEKLEKKTPVIKTRLASLHKL